MDPDDLSTSSAKRPNWIQRTLRRAKSSSLFRKMGRLGRRNRRPPPKKAADSAPVATPIAEQDALVEVNGEEPIDHSSKAQPATANLGFQSPTIGGREYEITYQEHEPTMAQLPNTEGPQPSQPLKPQTFPAQSDGQSSGQVRKNQPVGFAIPKPAKPAEPSEPKATTETTDHQEVSDHDLAVSAAHAEQVVDKISASNDFEGSVEPNDGPTNTGAEENSDDGDYFVELEVGVVNAPSASDGDDAKPEAVTGHFESPDQLSGTSAHGSVADSPEAPANQERVQAPMPAIGNVSRWSNSESTHAAINEDASFAAAVNGETSGPELAESERLVEGEDHKDLEEAALYEGDFVPDDSTDNEELEFGDDAENVNPLVIDESDDVVGHVESQFSEEKPPADSDSVSDDEVAIDNSSVKQVDSGFAPDVESADQVDDGGDAAADEASGDTADATEPVAGGSQRAGAGSDEVDGGVAGQAKGFTGDKPDVAETAPTNQADEVVDNSAESPGSTDETEPGIKSFQKPNATFVARQQPQTWAVVERPEPVAIPVENIAEAPAPDGPATDDSSTISVAEDETSNDSADADELISLDESVQGGSLVDESDDPGLFSEEEDADEEDHEEDGEERLPTLEDLRAMGAELDEIDARLEALDSEPFESDQDQIRV